MKSLYLFLAVLALCLICFLGGRYIVRPAPLQIERDTIYSVDTIRLVDTVPKLVYSEVVRVEVDTFYSTDSVLVPIYIPISHTIYSNRLISGNDTVSYTAHVSGYKARLDSIDFEISKQRMEVRETILSRKQQRWSIVLSAGVAIGYDNRFIGTPYLGVGVGYTLIRF